MARRFHLLLLCLASAFGCNDLLGPFQNQSDRFCCSDLAVCEQWGAPGLVPCTSPGQICGELNRCIDDPSTSECEGPQDCLASDKPACVMGVCVECDPEGPVSELVCPADEPHCSTSYTCAAGCLGDEECTRFADTPRCAADGTCQACRPTTGDTGLSPDCDAAAPICASGSCRGCAADLECGTDGVCDEATGTCVSEADLIIVAVTGVEGAPCTRSNPCRHIKEGVDRASGTRKWVIVGAGTYDQEPDVTRVTDKDVNIVAPDATLADPRSAPAIIVEGGATVSIEGLTVTAGGTAAGHGIDCRNVGAASPRLVLRRVTISENSGTGLKAELCHVTIDQSQILANTRGGISLSSSDFVIVNTIIAGNGSPTLSDFGGVKIAATATTGGGIFEFNTIANSSAQAGVASGVQCVAVGLVASNNIVYDENVAPGTAQVSGNCTWSSSLIGPTAQGGNLSADPKFVSPTANNYRLGPTSPAINAADTAATLSIDFEGDHRPQRGDRRDIGADEARDD